MVLFQRNRNTSGRAHHFHFQKSKQSSKSNDALPTIPLLEQTIQPRPKAQLSGDANDAEEVAPHNDQSRYIYQRR